MLGTRKCASSTWIPLARRAALAGRAAAVAAKGAAAVAAVAAITAGSSRLAAGVAEAAAAATAAERREVERTHARPRFLGARGCNYGNLSETTLVDVTLRDTRFSRTLASVRSRISRLDDAASRSRHLRRGASASSHAFSSSVVVAFSLVPGGASRREGRRARLSRSDLRPRTPPPWKR